MPFDPSKPATNAPLSSAEMRDQLTSLHAEIQQRVTNPELNNAIGLALGGTSNNSNAVGQMSLNVDPNYSQAQMQQIADKLDELILALRR